MIDLLVPAVIFIVGILVSMAAGGLGLQRLVEAQKAAGEALGRTATYEGPFRAEHDSIHGSR
jgi:CHASE1-domain containing sensor protein